MIKPTSQAMMFVLGALRGPCVRLLPCQLLLGLLVLGGCASPLPGVHRLQSGQPTSDIDLNAVNAQSVEYRLEPHDVLLVQVHTLEDLGSQHRIEKGNQLHIALVRDESRQAEYRLVVGDELRVDITTETEASYTALVNPDGRITLPKLGRSLQAAGRTLDELVAAASQEYRRLLVSPRIAWSITRPFNEQLTRNSGEFPVGADGDVVLPSLGRVVVLGRTASEVAADLTTKASTHFGNAVLAHVSVAQVNTREQCDNRLTPCGLGVGDDGTLYVFGLGQVPARGKTPQELRDEIARRLRPRYQNPISVNVSVQDYADASVYIGGEVRQPGRYPFKSRLSLLKLIAQAGWGTQDADLAAVLLLRPTGDNEYTIYRTNLTEVIDGQAPGGQDLRITPQDLVIVPPSGVAKANRFVTQYIRGILPFTTNVTYNFTSTNNNLLP